MAEELQGEVYDALIRALNLDVSADAIRLDMALHAPPIRMDSLGFYRLIATLERALDIRLNETTMADALVETVGDLMDVVRQHLDTGAPP